MSKLEQVIQGFYNDLDAAESVAYKRIAVAHSRAIDALSKQLDIVTAKITDDLAKGLDPNTYYIQQQRLASFLTQANQEFQQFGTQVGLALTQAQSDAVALASQFVPDTVISLNGDAPTGFTFAQLPEPAIRQFVGTLGDGSPLRTLTESFGTEASTELNRIMLNGVSTGLNPLQVARQMKAAVPSLGISRARTIARTEMMRAYREANRRTMLENQDIVKGWRWYSALDRNTCPVCWAMHGREFKLTVSMATHPNCRCSLLPITYTWRELGFDIDEPTPSPKLEPGYKQFAKLSENDKRFILGKGGYLAYSKRLVTLDDFVLDTFSPDWGYGRTTRSLRSIVGSSNAQQLSKGIIPQNLDPSKYRIQLPEVGDPFIAPKTKLADFVESKKLYQSEADDILKALDEGKFPDAGEFDSAIDTLYWNNIKEVNDVMDAARVMDVISEQDWWDLVDEISTGKIDRTGLDTLKDSLNDLIAQKKGQIQAELDILKAELKAEIDKSKLFGNMPDSVNTYIHEQLDLGTYSADDMKQLIAHHSQKNLANNPFKDFEKVLDATHDVGGIDDAAYQAFKDDLANNAMSVSEVQKYSKHLDDLYQKNKPISDPWTDAPDSWNKISSLHNQGKLTSTEYNQLYYDVLNGNHSVVSLEAKADELETLLANKVTKSSQQLLDELNATHLSYPDKQDLIQKYKSKVINKEDMQKAIDDAWINHPHPPSAAPNPVTTPINKIPIPNPGELTKVKDLGGSTGAELHADAYGNRFVVKRGNSAGHLREESLADSIYDAIGIDVPEHELFGNPPIKVARYIDGKTLNSLTGTERAAAEAALRERFASDALLGNWDVIGLSEDNILVDTFGKVYRIDNGGALRYRAQGGLKSPNQWTKTVDELVTMRDPSKQSGKIFGSLTDEDVADQIQKYILPNRTKILSKVSHDPDLFDTLNDRIDYLDNWAKNVKAKQAQTKAANTAANTFNSASEASDAAYKAYSNGKLTWAEYKKIQKVYYNIGSNNPWGKYVDEDYFINYTEKQMGLKSKANIPSKSLPYKKHVQALEDLKNAGHVTQSEIDDLFQKYALGQYKNKDIEGWITHRQYKIGGKGNISAAPDPRTFRQQWDSRGFWQEEDKYYNRPAGRGYDWYNHWSKTTSAQNRRAISEYTGSDYDAINRWNRSGRPDQAAWRAKGEYTDVATLKRQSDGMDAALQSSYAPEDMVVIRNSKAKLQYAPDWVNPQPGGIIWDDGYMSTSADTSWGGFTKCGDPYSNSKAFQLVLSIPKGGNAAFVKPISNHKSENEVIIPRGAKIEIVEVEEFVDSCGHKANRIFGKLIG